MASSSSHRATSTLSSSSTYRQKCEVFLCSFEEDSERYFTYFLYATLKGLGIIVFKGDEKLRQGEKIHPHLKGAIEESQYAVVVISLFPISSLTGFKSRLFELELIMERRGMGCLTVFPVFYGVNPFDVRNQTGCFGASFKQVPKAGKKQLEKWKVILTEIGDCSLDSSEVVEDPIELFGGALEDGGKLSGWHVKNREDFMQIRSKVVNKISFKIFGELIHKSIDNPEFLVGIESQAMKIMELIRLEESDGVRFIGICGMTGIGKTTLAKVIYERAHTAFEAWSFISDIGESINKSLGQLQRKLLLDLQVKVADLVDDKDLIKMLKELLKNKKVLIILDDVHRSEQVEALAGSAEWFGKGSRIILTSRNHYLPPHLCRDNRNFHIYEVNKLSDNAALQLFCFRAFNKLHPEEEFKRLTKDIVDFAQGLPLALEVFGSKLSRLVKSRWENYLIQIKTNLDEEVKKKLRINFDELGDLATKAFLDIICFLKGQSKSYVTYTLECLGYPKSILEDLKHKCLFRIEENELLHVHNFLTQMDHEIAKRAGLWHTEDILIVLREKQTLEPNAIRGILLKFPPSGPERLCYDAFSWMKKLALLEINTPESLIWSHLRKRFIELKWSGNAQEFSLSTELCVLRWDQYPFDSLPPGFKPANLVELKLRRSSIKALWGDAKRFHKLKYIDLHCSKELIEIPDFSDIPNLEHLDLSNCSNLSKVHHSIGFLERLREFSLRNCFRLRGLPNTFRLPSLTSLDLCGCSRRKKFPGGVRNLKSLRTLNLNNTAIKTLPRSFKSLSSFKHLYISGRCFSEEMTYNDFSGSTKLPDTRYRPSGLLTDARSVNIREWSSGFNSLQKLDLSYRNLGREALPKRFRFLSSLTFLNLSGNKFNEIPDSVHQLSSLRHFFLNNCVNLERLPRLPFELRELDLGNCPLLERFYEDFNALPSLKKSRPCDWMAAYLGDARFYDNFFTYDGPRYSFLNLHPGSTVWNNHRGHSVRRVAWGLSLRLEIPYLFYHRRMGRIPFPAAWHYDPKSVEGYALFIICEVPNPEGDVSFDCWLQDDEDGLGVHFRFPVPERFPSSCGVWMYIPIEGNESSVFVNTPIVSGSRGMRSSLALINPLNKKKEKEKMLLPSIEITSETLKIKKFGARLVCGGDEKLADLFIDLPFRSETSRDYFHKKLKLSCLQVHGPVKLPIDPSSKSSGDV